MINSLKCIALAVVLALSAAASAAADAWVYVSAAQDRQVIVYAMDGASGALAEVGRTAIEGEPGALTTSPDGRFLFVAIRSEGQLASLQIDSQTGKLSPISVVPVGADPAQISTDRQGQVLFTACYRMGKVTVHRIGPDGALGKEPLQEVPTAEKPHSIMPDPQNRFVFAQHTASSAIFQFRWDETAKKLSPAKTTRLEVPAGLGPRHLAWHPQRQIAYIINEQGGSVTAYRLTADGALVAGQTRSTLTAGFTGTNSSAEIKVHPSGKFLYASNRGPDSLAVLRLNDSGDEMTLVAFEPTENRPRSFDLDADGRFLIAAGENSSKLAVSAIDGDTGRLTVKHRYDTGQKPWWVKIVPR